MGPNNLGEEGRIAFSFGNQAQDEGAVLAEFAIDQGWSDAVIVKNNLLTSPQRRIENSAPKRG